ncbi:HI1506-related protein [Xenorhabdus cabanillasii]|uniref:Mu-like prophage FluMu N-terminal domain-containing protein n=1 Tax=Xenorhabdus cabanillasii JM26 TaxID=1427517 RepID=W1IRC8_9GAMM|nr:HI1506-related protein [Xenorhabdus cabanillasii]PHM76061.1 hypothetical protein Xcab_03443 [Xenorhabdus cabanillasii JM26]CDL80191.1 conserved hypothetical protein [Xenorhabdus cabanillasii JM26]
MPILITAKIDGFRRCGIAHSDKTTTYPDDRFTAVQLAELQADPMLVVSVVSDTDTPAQADTQSCLDALTAEVSRLTHELDNMTQTLGSVTAERDTLQNELAALKKGNKKAKEES